MGTTDPKKPASPDTQADGASPESLPWAGRARVLASMPPTAPDPAGAGMAGIAGLAGIELVLRQVIQAVSEGRDDRVGPLVDRLGAMLKSFTPADNAECEQAVARIQALWKQATLAIASASHEAGAELKRIAAGRKTRRAYHS